MSLTQSQKALLIDPFRCCGYRQIRILPDLSVQAFHRGQWLTIQAPHVSARILREHGYKLSPSLA